MSVTSEQLIEWSTPIPGAHFGPSFFLTRAADVKFMGPKTTYEDIFQMLQGASAVFTRLYIFDVDEFVEETLSEDELTDSVRRFAVKEGRPLANKPYMLRVVWLMGGALLEWQVRTEEHRDFIVRLDDLIIEETMTVEDQVKRAAAVVVKNQNYRRAAWKHRGSVAREVIKALGGVPDEIIGEIVHSASSEANDVVTDIEASIYQSVDPIVAEMVSSDAWAKATNQEKRKDIAAQVIAERYDGWAVSGSVLEILARTARDG